jgi:hypothetical protein
VEGWWHEPSERPVSADNTGGPSFFRNDSHERVAQPIRFYAVDFEKARRYLHDVEKLAGEARRTRDPRVLITALRMMAMQARTVSELGVRV